MKPKPAPVTAKQRKSSENLKPFKKGQSGNPLGAQAHDPAKKALKKLTIESYREVIELVLTGNLTDLKAMAENPSTPAIQVGVATAFMKAIKLGDYSVIERIAERIVGKIPDELNVNSKNINANLHAQIDKEKLKAALAKLESDV
jgi:hypothetical protein